MVTPSVPSKFAAYTADDAFHILRDSRALYLKQLGQLLQEAGHIPVQAAQAFEQTVGEYFDEMASPNRRSGFDVADGLTASRISLVGENDLELEIRLGNFSAHLTEAASSSLWRVYLRFVTLLRRPELNSAENPVGPKGIAMGLMDLCAQLEGESHEKKLARLDRLQDYFARHLTVLYDTLNNFFAERHIDMAQPSIVGAPEATPATSVSNAGSQSSPAMTLQENLREPSARLPDGQPGPATRALPQPMLNGLFNRLDELDQSGKLFRAPPAAISDTASSPSLESLLPGLFDSAADDPDANAADPLNAHQLGIPAETREAATIDTMAPILASLTSASPLPAAIKDVLSLLRIPLLKAALLDAGFFANAQHPARQVVDKIAQAALGLPPEIAASHPLCQQLQAIATRIRKEYSGDIKVFEQQVAALNAVIANRDAQVARSAEAYIPLLHQVERQNQAARRCRQIIEQHLAHGAPAEIAAFLRQHWSKLLQAVWLEHGEQGDGWRTQDNLVKDLLWSVQPKTDMEDRKRLAKMLQPMLQGLHAGMARIALPEAEQAAFLDTCFALQTAAMRGAAEGMAAIPPATPHVDSTRQASNELVVAGRRLRIIDRPSASSRPRPPSLQPGSWLRLRLEGEQELCACLCPGAADSNLLLFANPDWDFALAIHPEILDEMLASGRAHICSNDSLFDVASGKAQREPAIL